MQSLVGVQLYKLEHHHEPGEVCKHQQLLPRFHCVIAGKHGTSDQIASSKANLKVLFGWKGEKVGR